MKKVAILGKLETKYNAPFSDPTWEIWSTGLHCDQDLIPRIDKCFDIHKRPTNTRGGTIGRNMFNFRACHALVGGTHFNNTVSYLIARAILEGATHIALYGMRFDPDHNLREGQKQNVRELVFFARGRGIEVFDYDGIITKEFPNTDSAEGDLTNDFDTDFDT